MTKQKVTFFKPRHISSHFIRINIVSDLRSQNLFEHTNDVAENYSKALHDKAKGRLDIWKVSKVAVVCFWDPVKVLLVYDSVFSFWP